MVLGARGGRLGADAAGRLPCHHAATRGRGGVEAGSGGGSEAAHGSPGASAQQLLARSCRRS